jgi:hypothetical protein
VPGAEHNAGRGGEFGPYGERKRFDFFVRHLLGAVPPPWSETAPPPIAPSPATGVSNANPVAKAPGLPRLSLPFPW